MLKPGPNIGHSWIVIIGKELLTTEQEANIKKVSKHACNKSSIGDSFCMART